MVVVIDPSPDVDLYHHPEGGLDHHLEVKLLRVNLVIILKVYLTIKGGYIPFC